MSGSASSTDSSPDRVRSSSALSLSSSMYRTTAWLTSRSVSKRSSPRRPPTSPTVVKSSSRRSRNVDCSVSVGPNSSSSRASHSPPTATRASSANADGCCTAPRSVFSG